MERPSPVFYLSQCCRPPQAGTQLHSKDSHAAAVLENKTDIDTKIPTLLHYKTIEVYKFKTLLHSLLCRNSSP